MPSVDSISIELPPYSNPFRDPKRDDREPDLELGLSHVDRDTQDAKPSNAGVDTDTRDTQKTYRQGDAEHAETGTHVATTREVHTYPSVAQELGGASDDGRTSKSARTCANLRESVTDFVGSFWDMFTMSDEQQNSHAAITDKHLRSKALSFDPKLSRAITSLKLPVDEERNLLHGIMSEYQSRALRYRQTVRTARACLIVSAALGLPGTAVMIYTFAKQSAGV